MPLNPTHPLYPDSLVVSLYKAEHRERSFLRDQIVEVLTDVLHQAPDVTVEELRDALKNLKA